MELIQRYSKLGDPSKIIHIIERRPVPVAHPHVHEARRRLGPEVARQLVADYIAGASTAVLMQRYQLGKGTVLRILDQEGVTRRQKTMTDGQLQVAAELYRQGWSLVRLGEHFGFDQSTIWSGLRRLGVSMRRPWER